MDPIITGSLILGGVSALSNMASYGANRNLTQKMWEEQKDYNTAEREAAQAYNTSERLAVQDYNSPKSQMERLMSAGINPNTAAGMVSSPNSNAQSISGASASPQIADMPSPFGDMAYYAQQASQIRLTNAQAKRQEIENNYLDDTLSLSNEQVRQVIRNIKADTDYKKAMEGLTSSQRKQVDQLMPILVRKGETEIAHLEKAIQVYDEQIKTEQKQRDVMDSQIATNESQQAVNYTAAGVNKAQIGVLSEQRTAAAWENSLRDVGIDPNGDLGVSVLSILVAHPDTGTKIIKNLIESIKNNYSTIKEETDKIKNDLKPYVPNSGHRFPFDGGLFNQ